MPELSDRFITAAVGMGSNLGDRCDHLAVAARALKQLPHSREFRFSSVYETQPVHCRDNHPFLNAVAIFETQLQARKLLDHLHVIEDRMGRTRPYINAPRPMDLDLLLYGRQIIDEPECKVPHPRLCQRLFVLIPLVEIWPEANHPVLDQSVRSLLAAHPDSRNADAGMAVILKSQESMRVAL